MHLFIEESLLLNTDQSLLKDLVKNGGHSLYLLGNEIFITGLEGENSIEKIGNAMEKYKLNKDDCAYFYDEESVVKVIKALKIIGTTVDISKGLTRGDVGDALIIKSVRTKLHKR